MFFGAYSLGCTHFLFLEVKMSKQKCNYCGKEIETIYMSTLENGSPACPECVDAEEKRKQDKKVKGE